MKRITLTNSAFNAVVNHQLNHLTIGHDNIEKGEQVILVDEAHCHEICAVIIDAYASFKGANELLDIHLEVLDV